MPQCEATFSCAPSEHATSYEIHRPQGTVIAVSQSPTFTVPLDLPYGTHTFFARGVNVDGEGPFISAQASLQEPYVPLLPGPIGDFSVSLVLTSSTPGGANPAVPTAPGGGTELANWTFSDNAKPAAAYAGSQNGGSIGYSNGFVRASYPAPSEAVYAWLGLDVSAENTDNIYLDFDARMPGNVNGFKFVKVFGKTNGGAYSNCTFALAYGTGVMAEVSFGDGSTSQNDTQQVLKFDGSNPSWIGRSYNNGAVVSTPQSASFSGWSDNAWHNFKLGVKFNSGTSAANETNDGTFYVEIDGNVYCDASGLFNRYWGASDIEMVELFGYAANGLAFDMDYDNIVISKDGFI